MGHVISLAQHLQFLFRLFFQLCFMWGRWPHHSFPSAQQITRCIPSKRRTYIFFFFFFFFLNEFNLSGTRAGCLPRSQSHWQVWAKVQPGLQKHQNMWFRSHLMDLCTWQPASSAHLTSPCFLRCCLERNNHNQLLGRLFLKPSV